MKSKKPEWITEWRRRTRLINLIERAYEVQCDCEVCRELREIGFEMGEQISFTGAPGIAEMGGGETRQRLARRK